ncbi:unnamed protein product [Protopolystoma xenopodis]|uniref:Uncharacterized protein n=1 Tax=Protopolystoma xenopodis TaxID=117903 RepID=A0A3S5ASN2_9PLAT|nr:unnamed protein product [Protopolystoma xenopodis]
MLFGLLHVTGCCKSTKKDGIFLLTTLHFTTPPTTLNLRVWLEFVIILQTGSLGNLFLCQCPLGRCQAGARNVIICQFVN